MMQQTKHKQLGLSMISLFIAMAVGIFLIGGVIKIYANSKISFNTRNVVADVTEIQRFALDDMRRILVMVGREIRAIEDQSTATRPFPAVGPGGIVDGGAGSDEIAVRYRRGPSCGAYLNIPMSQPPATVRFFLNGTNLMCSVNGATSMLASNVYALKALYGVDTDDDGFADSYISASNVNLETTPSGSSSPWARVVSMRIGLMAGSITTLPREARPTVAELGAPPTVLGTIFNWPDNTRIYKVASTTLSLRNLNTVVTRK
jgi:type IV pilus assembly protein PilW